MDKAVKKLRPVSSNKNGLAKRILLQNTDWDGKYPIAVKWYGGSVPQDMFDINILHTSGDDRVFWVKDATSAAILFLKGHDIVNDPRILAKRKTFN